MEKCDSGLCLPINSSASAADRKSAKSRAKIGARRHARKKGNMTHKNVAAAAGLEKKTIDLQQVHEASFTSFREKLLLIYDE